MPERPPDPPACGPWLLAAEGAARVVLVALRKGERRHPTDSAIGRALLHARLLIGDVAVLRREGRS